MHHRLRRSAVAVCSVAALCLITALSGSASAIGSKGIKGDPQPELKPFKVGVESSGGGTVAIESNGNLVVAWGINTSNDAGATAVCLLARGGSKCSHLTRLTEPAGNVDQDAPQVYALSGDRVVVLREGDDDNPAGDDFLYTSTDGGKTFGAPVRVASIAVGSSVLVGGNIVFSASNPHVGWQIQGIADNAASGPGTAGVLSDVQPESVNVSTYKGGVVAVANLNGDIQVDYAESGKDFSDATSYANVATIHNEEVLGLSGNALLTIQETGNDHVELRLFNGTTLGAPHAVPDFKGHDLGLWSSISKDSSGVTHVFLSSEFGTPSYGLQELSTTTGAHWTGETYLGNAITNDSFSSAVDSIGSGLVLGTDPDSATRGYPVLATQSVTFALTKSSIAKGHKATGKGKGTVAAAGRKVELQIEKSGKWYDVMSTHEKANGSFKFSIKGTSKGTFHYRAVAADHAGYVQFGYSSSRALTVH
jgi:hypothetical protein